MEKLENSKGGSTDWTMEGSEHERKVEQLKDNEQWLNLEILKLKEKLDKLR